MNNDLAFVVAGTINLYEHQSTYNPNMPEEQILRLSDAFKDTGKEADVELRVKMLNINYGYNKELMEKCRVCRYCQRLYRRKERDEVHIEFFQ